MEPLLNLARLSVFIMALSAHGAVRQERVPEGGVQPQVAMDSDGAVHLVYLKGEADGCDVRYACKLSSSSAWSAPVTVNSEPRSAMAKGTIRGAQIAIGKDHVVHIVWNGAPRHVDGVEHPISPLFYSRMTAKGSFSPQRDMLSGVINLDGGASVAANENGEVLIAWHGARDGQRPGEINRLVFTLTSHDNGEIFAPLKIANEDYPGVCACCSLRAFVNPVGERLILYRAARSMTQRDLTQLTSNDGGATFSHRPLHPWTIGACPMSSAAMTASGQDTRAAWETDGRIYVSLLGANFEPVSVSGNKARHPSLAVNDRGETLVTWSVGTGWQRGGEFAWVVLDPSGHPSVERGVLPGVPVWGSTAGYSERGKDFVILY